MNRDNIKKGLSKLNEENISGKATTDKVQNTSKKSNDAYYKDVEKKMKEYDKEITSEDEDAIEPKKTNAEGDEKDYHDEMEIRNGQEMLNYDNDPGEVFTDRALKAIEGDSTMGNKTYTGEENGNTEPVWGASDAEFGKKLVDTIKKSKKKRDDATGTFNQFGDDIEMAPGKPKVSKKKTAIGEGMKRIKFKRPFGGVENALNLIPEAFRVDGKIFELTDGNEKYKVLWTEGAANVLDAEDKNMLSEDYKKMKHLMGFKVGADAGTLDGLGRVQENKTLAAGFAEGNGFAPIEETEEDIEEDVNHFGMGGSDEDHLEDKEQDKNK